MKKVCGMVLALVVLTGCGPVAPEPPGTDVSGTYTGHSVDRFSLGPVSAPVGAESGLGLFGPEHIAIVIVHR